MFRNYLKLALRNLLRNKFISLVNIGGLSVGLSCCILILLYAKDELSFDRFHENLPRLYQLTCHRFSPQGEDKHFAIAAMVQGPAFKKAIPEIASFARVFHQTLVVRKDNASFNEMVTWTDQSFFSMFSFPLLAGDPKRALAGTHSLILSEDAAKKYFGTGDAVGTNLELEIDGRFQPFVIAGIARNAPENSSIQFNILLPFQYMEELHPDNGWMWVSYPTYFSLFPNADIHRVEYKMNQVFMAGAKDELSLNSLMGYSDRFVWGLQPLANMHLQREFEGNPGAVNPVYSLILSGIAIFILLIACINFINLSIAQSLKRDREIGLRKVIGALRAQLVRQFLMESFFICFIAFLVALMLSDLLLPLFGELSNKRLSLSYLLDWKLLGCFTVLFVLTGFAAGFYPAIVLSGLNPVQTLVRRAKLGGKNWLGRSLVVLQFSLAGFLIICTVFIYLQFEFLTKTDLGYNDRDLVEITIANSIMDKSLTALCKNAFSQTPGVEKVASQNVGKFGGKTMVGTKELNAVYQHIDQDYLPVLEIPLVAGRNLSRDFPTDSAGSVLVNERFVQAAGWKDAIGKTIDYMNFPDWGDRRVRVVGVVKDYHVESLKEKIKPEVLTMEASMPLGKFLVKIKGSGVPGTIQALEKVYRQLFPFHPFVYDFKNDLNYRTYDEESRIKKMISFGAIFTILISCVGLFGLTLLSVNQRTKEIGIRKVLGSGVLQVGILLSGNFVFLVLIAFAMAAPAAWFAVSRWLENFAYKIHMSWWIFIFSGLLMLFVAILTVAYQSLKAAMMNPIRSLRTE